MLAFNVDIAVVTDTWSKIIHPDPCVDINGYSMFHHDRTHHKGSGICIPTIILVLQRNTNFIGLALLRMVSHIFLVFGIFLHGHYTELLNLLNFSMNWLLLI
jgi:hypothetical protein